MLAFVQVTDTFYRLDSSINGYLEYTAELYTVKSQKRIFTAVEAYVVPSSYTAL